MPFDPCAEVWNDPVAIWTQQVCDRTALSHRMLEKDGSRSISEVVEELYQGVSVVGGLLQEVVEFLPERVSSFEGKCKRNLAI